MAIIYICVVIVAVIAFLSVINMAAFAWNERDFIPTILFLCSVVAFLLSIYGSLRIRRCGSMLDKLIVFPYIHFACIFIAILFLYFSCRYQRCV